MNYIWGALMIVSIVFAVINGRLEQFTKAIFDGAASGVDMSLTLAGIVAIWLGITQILEDSGFINKISGFFRPAVSRLFKGIPEGHKATSSITLNFLANLFGTGNAATALGIKAMNDLQELNPDKNTVTFDQMLFIVINTSSIQLIPFTVIGFLAKYSFPNPAVIVVPVFIATILSSALAVFNLFMFRRFFK